MIQSVPRGNFQGAQEIQPGMQFQAQTSQGPRVVTVVKVDPDEVTVDANHPLAGLELSFDVTVRGVREASAEEIAHGHAHGVGGNHH
jgi:FKBP-type peptidyl-prolyl cis-trans isomerase SlyD